MTGGFTQRRQDRHAYLTGVFANTLKQLTSAAESFSFFTACEISRNWWNNHYLNTCLTLIYSCIFIMLGLRVNRRRNFENAGVKGVAFSPEIVIEGVWKNSTFVLKKKQRSAKPQIRSTLWWAKVSIWRNVLYRTSLVLTLSQSHIVEYNVLFGRKTKVNKHLLFTWLTCIFTFSVSTSISISTVPKTSTECPRKNWRVYLKATTDT